MAAKPEHDYPSIIQAFGFGQRERVKKDQTNDKRVV